MKKNNLKQYKKQLESVASKDLAQAKGGTAAAPTAIDQSHAVACW